MSLAGRFVSLPAGATTRLAHTGGCRRRLFTARPLPKRQDAADTVESATHELHYEQANGWVLESKLQDVEYGEVNSLRIPIRKTITITLIPARDHK